MKTPLPLAALALLLTATAAPALDYMAGPLKITQPWSRATPAGARVGGGYLVIENTGTAPDRLVAVSTAFAEATEIHEMALANGVMTMRELEKGLDIAPGARIEFKPGGFHIMFMGLKAPLKQGAPVKGTLRFEKAGTVEVEFSVEPVGAKAPAQRR